jgi:hypothetical protein
MDGSHVAETAVRRIDTVVTVIGMAALVAVAYRLDRDLSRWLSEHHPLAGYRRRVAGVKTDLHEKRTTVTEDAELVGDVLLEIARAIAR